MSATSGRVAVYNLYWDTLGGGEQVAGAIGEELSRDHDVDLLGPKDIPVAAMRDRLGLDVSRTRWRQVANDEEASAASADYDLFINTTYLSRAVNRARQGLYYVHFPEPPRTARDQRRADVSERIADLLGRSPLQPSRVTALRRQLSRDLRPTGFAATYRIVGNSQFTSGWVRRLWGVDADVLYPPVRLVEGHNPKRRTIVSVGRFFDSSHGHSKNQLVMVEAFRELVGSGDAEGWELHLIGGCDRANREYFNAVRKAALGLPVHLHLNASGAVFADVVETASIYWHAGGYGQDPEVHPDRCEHFGIAVVEAMSAGAVPVVFGVAGPAEIVRPGIDGQQWTTKDQLATITAGLIGDPQWLATLSRGAAVRSKAFGRDVFAAELRAVIAAG